MEYMEQGLKEQFAQLDKKAVKTLCDLPTLFMYEEQLKLPGRLGRITSIHKHSGTVFFNFKVDPHSPPSTGSCSRTSPPSSRSPATSAPAPTGP